jgi:hypothetical protein
MKSARFLTSVITILVLIAIDNKAPGAIAEYGDLMRAVVWTLILINGAQVCESVRDYLDAAA